MLFYISLRCYEFNNRLENGEGDFKCILILIQHIRFYLHWNLNYNLINYSYFRIYVFFYLKRKRIFNKIAVLVDVLNDIGWLFNIKSSKIFL